MDKTEQELFNEQSHRKDGYGTASDPDKASHYADIDDFLVHIGEFGKFQMCVEFLFCIAMVPSTLQVLASYFVSNNPPWQCAPGSTVCTLNRTIDLKDPLYRTRCQMNRNDWEFSEPSQYSVVTEFDLSCKKEVFIYLTTSVYFLGWAIGAVLLGWLADSRGRKLALYVSLFGMIAFGLSSAFAPNIWIYLVLRFLVGFFQPGTGPQMSIFISEFVGPKRRPMASIVLFVFYTIGLLALGVKAYFIRNWRKLLIVCSAPYALILLSVFYIPESVRWLHAQGKTKNAMEILHRIAKTNGTDFPSNLKLKPVHHTVKDASSSHFMLFFKSRTLLLRTIIQCICWLVFGLVYFGLSLAADDFGGGLYSDFMLACVVEFPAALVAIVACDRYGRKFTVISGLLAGALACIVLPFFPVAAKPIFSYLRVTCGLLGKFFVTISFDAVYTWSFELFATVVRAEGMGFMQVTSRIGAATAPWITKGLDSINAGLPFYIIGGISLLTGLSLFVLPETKGVATAETIDDSDVKPKMTDIEECPLIAESTPAINTVQV